MSTHFEDQQEDDDGARLPRERLTARGADMALDATRAMVSLYAPDGGCLFANGAARDAYGGDGAAPPPFQARFSDSAEGAKAWESLCRGKVYRCESRFRTTRGLRWHALEARPTEAARPDVVGGPGGAAGPVVDGAEAPVDAVVVTEYDVTDYVQGRISLQDTVDSLAHSNMELERFAWITSHDLREPLRNVVSYLNLLKRHVGGDLDGEAADYMRFAIEGALRLDTLTRDLAEYASIGRGGETMAPVDMAEVVAAVEADLADEIAATGAEVRADGLPVVVGDAQELRMLMAHLLANALKYVADDVVPRVTISVEREDRAWVFAVIDNGIGIERRYFNRIFDIFQRLHGRDAYGGTGVGLAICRKVVERHGGRIWVESAPGKGTAFFFSLPLD